MKTIFLSLALIAGMAASTLAADKPNILFIFADDQCYETIRQFGHTDIDTPNLDRLANTGTVFTHAYNMGAWNGAVCIASRTMLNTGRFLWHAHRIEPRLDEERDAGRLWGPAMKRAGYDTYMTGKWHLKTDAARAFDVTRHIRPGMPKDTPEGYNRPIEGKPDVWKPWDKKFGGFWEGGTHWSEVAREDARGFLNTAAGKNNPFFMYIAFNAAHDPRQSPKEYVDMYPLDRIKVPRNFLPLYPYKDAIGCGESLRDEKLAPFPRTEYAIKVHRREYYALITHLDTQIGMILDSLKHSGKADNTWIFFTADHGLAVGHHGLVGKQNMFDDSLRVPLIVVGPGVARGRKIDAPVYLQDIMPTTLELAGQPVPDHVEFHSLLPLLRNETRKSPYDAIYGGYLKLQRAVIADGYKMILYPEVPKALLFDLRKDPDEMHDLSGKRRSAARMKKLFAKLLELQKENGDELDLKAVFPELL